MDDKNVNRFPTFEVGHIYNPIKCNIEQCSPKFKEIEIWWPCRLDAMAINPEAVTYNEKMVFTPGEVVVSINNFIKTRIKLLDEKGGKIVVSERSKRKALVKHAYYLMSKLLNITPSVEVDVDDRGILKHCGFGSSSSTISSVVAALNEMYGKPIKNKDLIKYVSSNHGEEIEDENENELKAVQSIGGGASSGFLSSGIIIIAGHATPIAQMNFKGNVIVGVPRDFEPLSANILMKREEDNLWRFKKTGKKYKDIIAYSLLHKALPEMVEGKISELANVVFDYRFNMGSIRNCAFVYPKMIQIAKSLKDLFEKKHCIMLSLSSVGPAFFAITNNKKDTDFCKKIMRNLNMNVSTFQVFNRSYIVKEANNDERCKKRILGK